jgi:hypothetical protein
MTNGEQDVTDLSHLSRSRRAGDSPRLTNAGACEGATMR